MNIRAYLEVNRPLHFWNMKA